MVRYDYVDTGVWIGAFVENSYECRSNINSTKLRHKNNAVIGHFVLSEFVTEVITSEEEGDVEGLAEVTKQIVLDTVLSIISMLWREEVLTIIKLQDVRIDCELIEELQHIERNLSYDDALHLCVAIRKGCQRFLTTDNLFDVRNKKGSVRLVRHLNKKYGLKVRHIKK